MEKYQTKESVLLGVVIEDLEKDLVDAKQRREYHLSVNDLDCAEIENTTINELSSKIKVLVGMQESIDKTSHASVPTLVECGFVNKRGEVMQKQSFASDLVS